VHDLILVKVVICKVLFLHNFGLPKLFLINFLLSLLFTGKLGLDHSQKQINEEKGTNKHNWQDQDIAVDRPCLLEVYHYVTPTFQSNTLEDHKERKHKVVKVGHTEIGIRILLATEVTFWTYTLSTAKVLAVVICTVLDPNAPVFQDA